MTTSDEASDEEGDTELVVVIEGEVAASGGGDDESDGDMSTGEDMPLPSRAGLGEDVDVLLSAMPREDWERASRPVVGVDGPLGLRGRMLFEA